MNTWKIPFERFVLSKVEGWWSLRTYWKWTPSKIYTRILRRFEGKSLPSLFMASLKLYELFQSRKQSYHCKTCLTLEIRRTKRRTIQRSIIIIYFLELDCINIQTISINLFDICPNHSNWSKSRSSSNIS